MRNARWAYPESPKKLNSFKLYDIFNFGKIQEGSLVVEKAEAWDDSTGFDLKIDLNAYKCYRRWDCQSSYENYFSFQLKILIFYTFCMWMVYLYINIISIKVLIEIDPALYVVYKEKDSQCHYKRKNKGKIQK